MNSVQQVIKDQDEHIDEIGDIVKRLKNNSRLIENEIDHQKIIIKGLDEDMTKTEDKMNFAMKKLSALLKTQSESQIRLFLTLLCVAIVMFLILIL